MGRGIELTARWRRAPPPVRSAACVSSRIPRPADGQLVSRDPVPAAAVYATPVGTFGDIATAAFIVAAASGVAVAIPYQPGDAYGSIATMLLANPAAAFFRNLHYWSGQVCLLATLLHVWDHLRARTEGRVSRGVWLRLTLTLPLVAFLMLSGFMLRGDAEGRQALRIVADATSQVPLVGWMFSALLLGIGDRLDLLYVQHAATATIIVWLFIIEHARRVWSRVPALLAVLAGTGALSLVVSPGLHNGFDPVVKGPWYFLGLQEILHWTPWPLAVVGAGTLVVATLYALRVTRPTIASTAKRGLLILLVAYLGLCGVGALLRGETWEFTPTSPLGAGNLRFGFVFASTPVAPSVLPLVAGRPEGCLVCHKDTIGLGASHRPDAVGCASCHGGDAFTLDKARAHVAMALIPGNLDTARARCGQSTCHPTIIPRIDRSLMTTMSGVIAVNRAVFGEPSNGQPPALPHVMRLSHSAADQHARQLCASCHLGLNKVALGPNGEDARGGGCNACHLVYSPAALAALTAYERNKSRPGVESPRVHPAISLEIGNGQCFGCHSRSGRISTSYEGWHEMHEPPASASDPARSSPSRFRTLADDRVFERVMPDIHQQRGLDCIDCHTANEVMGDGVAHAKKQDQVRVACEDCHVRLGDVPSMVSASALDPESRKIVAVRQWPGAAPSHFVRTASGETMVNVFTDATGVPSLVRKRTGERRTVKATKTVCVEGRGHARLSCGSCHTAWAPRCPTCHTSYEPNAEAYDWVDDENVRGAWKEKSGPFAAEPPTLGVRRRTPRGSQVPEVIDTFVPGMILTIDKPAAGNAAAATVFRRLYARIEPHTTRLEARSCRSCHNDPVALGYGRGELRFERLSAGGRGRWRFTPAMPILPNDGLPADAWIPFLGTRTGIVSTRDDVRPFSVEEQRRILTVGACLTCHEGDSRAMRESVKDFERLTARRRSVCLLPVWK
jgi:quinol-cytochrome oxidoreductase complex cytochrome b subunit